MFKNFTSQKFEIKILLVILFTTFLVYLNHFDNPFFFDDTHTISENESIRSLDNWTSFFTNADTFSSLPENRAYRPMITLMNAIDYSFADGLNARYFHYHIFFWYLILIVLLYLLCKHIYKESLPNYKWIGITVLFATAWFAFHTANAETVNYICARSDSFSTLCMVASLLLYIHPFTKKWHLYLITMVIGIWTKQTGVMFFPILFVYVLLFEEHLLLTDFTVETKKKIITIFKKIAPTGIIASSLFIFNQYYLTPASTNSTNFLVTRFEYISTQWYVIMHYLGNFILPISLSADPDIAIIKPWYNIKLLLGLFIILIMLFLMIKTAFKKELKPISFGIAWFFIALLPTTLNPLFQIANDHRMFFPFIGLFIAVPWGALVLLKKYKILDNNKRFFPHIIVLLSIILIGNIYGTIQRNKVWDTEESLWLDVVQKSPKNGRGMMNYGLTHMAKGNYDIALEYFNKADKLSPNYYVLHINLAILYDAKNNVPKAEKYFKSALKLNTISPSPDYYYARYLVEQKRYTEAQTYLKKALTKSPNHIQSKNLLSSIANKNTNPEDKVKTLLQKVKSAPNVESYIELSLIYYRNKEYQLVISTCKELLEIDPNNAVAYNNMCSAYNQMKQWKLGAEACRNALKIDPNYQLAKNNLKWATDNINK
ncbi:tetratricopeptide repeat protein [Aquimarina sp. 2201CG14-23]|uniref:tetratricopeptide repeat protein n=1 Tax=Aquimarina mycalae TaxID=3040073 RepID=UPI0024781523|nr:tetratricopeptide repeat protein [Aquimarina sp. 2201CG14-23]MDH7445055.1 tetratricopeptide repeat protein [Aquimarina sp. 2201CG14-23]